MQFQRAQPSIVRSIRHVSLMKNWVRARRSDAVPHFTDFVPDERAGDAIDIMIAEVHPGSERPRFHCRSAGSRVEQLLGRSIGNCDIGASVHPHLASTAGPIWIACVEQRMPMFSILPVQDRNGCPVTVEQLYLPYRLSGDHAEILVAAVHAWSTEGGFAVQGLLDDLAAAPVRWAVIVDPTLAQVAQNRPDVIEGN